jgi:hypothetical protein
MAVRIASFDRGNRSTMAENSKRLLLRPDVKLAVTILPQIDCWLVVHW